MPIQHDTVLNLIDLGKVAMTALGSMGAVAGVSLKVRSVQNKKLGISLVRALDEQVKKLAAKVTELEKRDSSTQTKVELLTDKLNESTAQSVKLTDTIDEIKKLLPQLQNTMQGVKSYFEKAKQQATSKVTFKEEKKKP